MKIVRSIALTLLALLFITAGSMHFLFVEKYVSVMPPYLPSPHMLVYISGVCEVLGGLGLLYKPTRRAASWGLVALLIAVFPANLYMAMAHVGYAGPSWVLWVRLPLQVPLILWAFCYTRPDARDTQAAA